jgi:putative peptide zinc metalloprotease protein
MTQDMAGEAGDGALPRLRPELLVERGATSRDHGAGWVVYDPVQHRHFQIDQTSYEVLSLWTVCETADALIVRAARDFGANVTREQIEALAAFLETNELCI